MMSLYPIKIKKPQLTSLLIAFSLLQCAHAGKQECYDAYQSKNYTVAFRECLGPAEAGDRVAQFNLGYMLANGAGTERNASEAARWYQKAADQGSTGAQYNLALLYENGQGVVRDHARAATLYQKLADQGHTDAQNNLGNLYRRGLGVPQDDTKAVQLFLQAALKGSRVAQYNMGDMYFYGYGVALSDTEALYWYRKSADQGYAAAQFSVGNMYLHGRSVEKSMPLAMQWFEKAAKQGFKQAQVQLDVLKKEQENPVAEEVTSQDIEIQLVSPREGSTVKGKTVTVTFRLSAAVEGFVPLVLVNGEEVQVTSSADLSGRVSLVTLTMPLPEEEKSYRLEIGGVSDDTRQFISAFLSLKGE
ncbi:sel1 repeat family protein [Deinococcus cellulosilyticus]|nr:sel1 repeat family protein [Deinococcus cellulosilyticus]